MHPDHGAYPFNIMLISGYDWSPETSGSVTGNAVLSTRIE